jgi:predicted DNA-binding transcriptional regulator AlpA
VSRPWPWKDTPLKQRERVALSYRALAEKLDPVACAQMDAEMLEFGVKWVVPQIITHQDSDLLSADLVADYCGVSLKTVYTWRNDRGLPSINTPDGIRFKFSDIQRWKGGDRL